MDDPIKRKKSLCVDFDGVLHSYMTPWSGHDVVADPPVKGAMDWLVEMELNPEYQVCIYSNRSRYRSGIRAMSDWVKAHIEESAYDKSDCDRTIDNLLFLSQKPAAYLTIDDRAICFNGVFPTVEEMDNFKPWFDKYAEKKT